MSAFLAFNIMALAAENAFILSSLLWWHTQRGTPVPALRTIRRCTKWPALFAFFYSDIVYKILTHHEPSFLALAFDLVLWAVYVKMGDDDDDYKKKLKELGEQIKRAGAKLVVVAKPAQV